MDIPTILIFLIVLFLYLHIYFHFKKNNDLELINIEQPPQDKLDEVCNLRQPLVFQYTEDNIFSSLSREHLKQTANNHNVNIRSTSDESVKDHKDINYYVTLDMKKTLELFEKDSTQQYITENNKNFLEDSTLVKMFQDSEDYFVPAMTSRKTYDLMMGSLGACTPLQYHIDYRRYIYVADGSVDIKLMPPNTVRKLNEIKDYNNFEFRSACNIWTGEHQDITKNNVVEMSLQKGKVICIPAYWWYTMKHNESSVLCQFSYRTYMSTISILPQILLSLLQAQNTTQKPFSSLSLEENKNDAVVEPVKKEKAQGKAQEKAQEKTKEKAQEKSNLSSVQAEKTDKTDKTKQKTS